MFISIHTEPKQPPKLVILSEAKDLGRVCEILRFAQDDINIALPDYIHTHEMPNEITASEQYSTKPTQLR
jgi:hypothetical protein